MCSASVQNVIGKCTIKRLRETSGLLSFLLHLTPPREPRTARPAVLAPTQVKTESHQRKNQTAHHSEAELPLSRALANRKPW